MCSKCSVSALSYYMERLHTWHTLRSGEDKQKPVNRISSDVGLHFYGSLHLEKNVQLQRLGQFLSN